ncbi:MAG TPA: serine hydrolase [Sphingobacterium sp.]|nr:serine hydrolase [Sphingobacterium sp.]
MMKESGYRLVLLLVLCACLLEPVVGQQLYPTENNTFLLYNRDGTIPLRSLDNMDIAVVTPTKTGYFSFIQMLKKYADVSEFDASSFAEDTKFFNTIIVVGTNATLNQNLLLEALQVASNGKNIIICTFLDNPNDIRLQTPRFGGRCTELLSTGMGVVEQEDMAMSLFGGVAITKGFPENRTTKTRIRYGNTNLSAWNIGAMKKQIDAIAMEAIQEKATPGMVVMAVKDGQVLFHEAYGHHTYDRRRITQPDDIFDLASISKIAGTTPVVMHLVETGRINLNKTMGDYLWDAKNTDKAQIPVRSVLLHEAGFTPFIPFYRQLKPGDLQFYPSDTHPVKVADGVYLRNNYYRDVMWPQMLNSPVKPMGNYVYSDISMYVMKEIAEHVSSTPMEEYVNDFLYKRIGMKTAGYNPRNRFDKERIVPTQNDTSFRKVLLEGYVHDEGAAMAGGVAGHAGLFGSANDLAIYGQMLLNKGFYGGVQYFDASTVGLFTSKQSKTSRRGLGFDRYDPNSTYGYPSKLANSSVYGHTGYTGTCIWIDPQNQLIYIFLSNRVHPQVSNKLSDLNVRSRIQDAIYETINNVK